MKNLLNFKQNIREQTHERNLSDYFLRLRCLDEAVAKFPAGTALDKSLAFLRSYGQEFVPFVDKDLCLASIAGYFYVPRGRAGLEEDIGHYCANYKTLVEEGVNGIRARIRRGKPTDETGRTNKKAFLESLDLFVAYMLKHAEEAERQAQGNLSEAQKANLLRMAADIRTISKEKPKTFLQGLQLVWFAHGYILLKPYTNTITFGNLDRILGGLYEADVQKGKLTREEALKILCHFILAVKPMHRDTQNICLGGTDEEGNYFENDLTLLFLQAQKIMHEEQPSLSLKIRPETSDEVWEAALDLVSLGGAMPSFLNDELYIRSLKKFGFDEAESNTYVDVGCYEATPPGNTFGGTVSGNVTLAYEFANFFAREEEYLDFESFLSAWEEYLENRYKKEIVPGYAHTRAKIATCAASPFTACIMDGCIESFRLPEQYGAKNNIFSVLFGGIGTLVDCLLCVKHFVFDEKSVSLAEYRKQVKENYPSAELLAKVRAFTQRFGSGEEYSNLLAKREAEFLHRLAKENPINNQTKNTPALFIFTEWATTEWLAATPDGRKQGDRYSYGASASELLPNRSLTGVLASSASLPLDLFPVGSPQTVNLMADMLKTKKGRQATRAMVETYFAEGGSHLQVEIADPNVLRDAQKHPERYPDLMIRLSGHTEPFVRLMKVLQDALIARSEL